MKIKSYIFDKKQTNKYFNFLKEHYKDDKRVDLYILEIKNQLSEKNPFFKFGKVRNFIVEDEGKLTGHCTAIIDRRNIKVGLIGFYDCIDCKDTSKLLLKEAISWLKEKNCIQIFGPVNLSIWNNYRFIVSQKRNSELFDPFSKNYYSKQWEENGFLGDGEYLSAIRTNFDCVIQPTKNAYIKLKKAGYKIRQFNIDEKEKELKLLRDLSNEIFSESWNYIKISWSEFEYLYKKTLKIIDPKYIEILEKKDGKPIGFCFSLPNPLNKNQIIMKTIGVLKEYQNKYLGAAIIHSQHLKAKKENYKEFYYPLIRKGNNVTKLPYPKYEILTEYKTYKLSQ